jgi:tellurite resistance protein TerC
VLGLRSMYFAVAGLMGSFRFLHYGLAAVLILVGFKMLTADHFPVSTVVSLAVVAGVLAFSIAASLLFPGKTRRPTSA